MFLVQVENIAHIISKGVKIDAICFGFMALCKVSSSYFYSVGKPGYAAILIYGDTFFMMPLGLVTSSSYIRYQQRSMGSHIQTHISYLV